LSHLVRAWFEAAFPDEPTPAQAMVSLPTAAGEHVLLVSPLLEDRDIGGLRCQLGRSLDDRYHCDRNHSFTDYLTPAEFERQYVKTGCPEVPDIST
jgi:hypothetical protein